MPMAPPFKKKPATGKQKCPTCGGSHAQKDCPKCKDKKGGKKGGY